MTHFAAVKFLCKMLCKPHPPPGCTEMPGLHRNARHNLSDLVATTYGAACRLSNELAIGRALDHASKIAQHGLQHRSDSISTGLGGVSQLIRQSKPDRPLVVDAIYFGAVVGVPLRQKSSNSTAPGGTRAPSVATIP
jgi:hypothetical protein